MKTKVTQGMNWTRYFNLYGMTDNLFDGLRKEGWDADKINEYTTFIKLIRNQLKPMQRGEDRSYLSRVMKHG